jgi:hypothetical protein
MPVTRSTGTSLSGGIGWNDDAVHIVNALTCEPDDTFGQGAFHARVLDLTERLGASVTDRGGW